MPSHSIRVAVAAALLATPCFSQILPGHSIATVAPSGQPGEMYDIDHQAGTASQLTISAALAAAIPNCVLMTNPVTGYVGTNAAPTGDIYAISVASGVVSETLLNTTPTAGGNVAQLAVLGNKLYFCTQTAGVLGSLQSVPTAGGPVTLELDIATLSATGLANACAVIGTKVFVATFNSSPANTATSPGELIEFDTVTLTGRIVLNLPPGGFAPVGNPWNTGIVNMVEDPMAPGILVLQGVYGDLLRIDPALGTVVSSTWTGLLNAGGNALASGTVNSFSFDPVAQDWVVGTRYAAIERWVGDQQAENKILGVGTHPTLTSNSITGIQYFPEVGGVDTSYGGGCAGNDGWKPTDSSFGAPLAGNTAFRLGLFSANPGDLAVLLIDFQNAVIGSIPLPADLGTYGAPNCFIRTGNLISTFVVTSGTGSGGGQAFVSMPLPSWAVGLNFYRQWAELQLLPTNGLGLVVSNARHVVVQ
ncbi:MAG: hypothetical protein KDC98_26750 [Planctomycetes bacterium]|nr:hypothetical protein [Planctomycetota bacterium]